MHLFDPSAWKKQHETTLTTRMSPSPILSQTIRRRYSGYVDAVIQRWALVMDEYLRRRQESEARLVEDILYIIY